MLKVNDKSIKITRTLQGIGNVIRNFSHISRKVIALLKDTTRKLIV